MANDNKVKTNKIELKVSEECYNEIASAMAASGVQISTNAEIVLNKDVMVKNPLDPRRMGLRKDAAEIAVKIFDGNGEKDFLTFAHEIEEFIAKGIMPTKPTQAKGWK